MIEPRQRRREITPSLVGMMLAALLVPLNSTMIAVALPDVADDLDVATGTTGVLVLVYLVTMLVGQPVAGRLGDIVGYRRVVVVALAGVGAASLGAVAVSSFAALVAVRGLQAVFAAGVVPNVQATIRATTAPERRGRIFGVFGAVVGAGAAVGPLLGGVVTALAGWPAVFLVNLPIVVLALLLVRGREQPAIDSHADGVAGSGAARAESRVWNTRFVGAFGTQALTTFGQYTLILVVPLMLDERGWGAGAVGAAVTSLTIGMVVMGPAGGSYGDRHGRRRPAAIGVGAAAVAIGVAAIAGAGIHAVVLVGVLTAYGVGFGFAAPSLITAAVESAPPERAATASGIFSTSRYTGSIPASVCFSLIIGAGVAGVGTLLVVAAACAAAALVTVTLLPARPVSAPALADR